LTGPRRNQILIPLILFLLLTGCSGSQPATTRPESDRRSSGEADWFVDSAAQAGLDFTHVNGMSGHLYMPEILGPGVALFDYDNDGDLDVYLVQSGQFGSRGPGQNDRLFRNDLRINPDGTRTLHFTDVTRESKIEARGYGMGVATGDFNNDGWVDLYLTKFGAPNQMLRNNGDGTFTDVSKEAGTALESWSVSAAFVDIDRDGWLDLYVGNYLRYTLAGNGSCFSPTGAPDYCTPSSFPPLPDRLYLNRRNGTFADITASSQIATEYGPALGVSTADFNGDGWMDIYVANDGKENQLWLNRHDLTFENVALASGVALPVSGKAEGSMGVDAGDVDNDGDEDLVMTELTGEGSNLYLNDGHGLFVDASASSMVGPTSLALTGFGAGLFDFDNDGRLDLLAVNGTVQIIESLRQARDPFPLHQKKLLLRNVGNARFEDVTGKAGAAFALSEVGRGAAFGDIDNDGDVDVVIANNNGPVRLLINQATRGRHWIGLRVVSGFSRTSASSAGPAKAGHYALRDMLGARVEIVRKNGGSLWRRSRADGSYASANDPRVLVGLGESADPVAARVRWPDGRMEMWEDLPVDRYITLKQGEGK
jgi:hypothetical protein